ncbi:hypothetical protein GCM10022393_14530 [Aquimarina addita]|uniref:Uncharacterized protein n=1 Tax=Aquimarina addita TaxID=870485 RepID=A0ABP7XGN9_9FLAO
MKNKEDELVSVQYRIEKSGIKQQKLEQNLVSISKELKKSKRNSLIFMIFFITIIVAMAGGMYYLNKNNDAVATDVHEETIDEAARMKAMNDSLQNELTKLKSDIENYRNEFITISDTLSNKISDDNLNAITTDTSGTNTKKTKFSLTHSYVKNVFRSGDVIFIEADLIEYAEGKKAVEKAKQLGKAEYDIDKEGDTLYFLYDNYFIHNPTSQIVRLELDDKVKIQGVNQISKGFPLKAFQKIIADNPVMVLGIHNGIVYHIKQQKLP